MEYLRIRFPKDRPVLVNGNPSGRTNIVIEIEAGTHTISLAPPPDFRPTEITVVLEPNQTSPLDPREVTFETV